MTERRLILTIARSGWRGAAAVATAVAGLLVVPAAAGAATPSSSLSGSAERSNGLSYSGTVNSDADGSDVRGTFTIKTRDGLLTVDATCLEVAKVPGGRKAFAGGRVETSTDPGQSVGSAVGADAFDSDNENVKDGLTLFALHTVPKPNECSGPNDRPSAISKGKLIIKKG
jgi:hypothetical protein